MQTVSISLDRLDDHPHNSNVMPPAVFEKLKGHLRDTGRYPPLIVRPLPQEGDGPPRYQLLDGHHRAKALRQLQHTAAQCVVWAVDEAEALVLLATLNRLEGRDDPRKRAALLREMSRHTPLRTLARRLPEDAGKAGRMLQLSRVSPPRRPQDTREMPLAVHFFLLPEHKRRLDAALRAIGGEREAALMRLVERAGDE